MESTPCVGNTALVINLLGQCKLKQRHGHNFSVLLNADDSSHGRHRLRGTQRQFLENVCSEDELRARIFGAFVVKFGKRYAYEKNNNLETRRISEL